MKTTRQYGPKAELALNMWVKLARAYGTFARHSAKDIERYHLTPPQFSVIETLGHLGPLTMGELGKKMLVTGGCMTVIVDNLEQSGLVERVRDESDRRIIHVRLTPAGTARFREIFAQHAQRIAELASVLTTTEQQRLALLLKKLGLALTHETP
jgi:MarR family 2-MHQ and catechol resistance regulon transcriptional repressor